MNDDRDWIIIKIIAKAVPDSPSSYSSTFFDGTTAPEMNIGESLWLARSSPPARACVMLA